MENFPTGVSQLRLTEFIENSVGLPATTLKGNAPSQNTRLSATLPRYACELTANLVFCSFALPFSVVNAGQPTSFSIEALYTSIRGNPCKKIYYVFLFNKLLRWKILQGSTIIMNVMQVITKF